jgi:hypothetical protein
MDWLRRRKILFIILGLFLVIWFNHNQMANWHFHIKNNGIVVMHAHPYKAGTLPDTPFQKHHHSNLEYLLLSLIFNTVPYFLALFIFALHFHFQIRNLFLSPDRDNMHTGFYRAFQVRGPPIPAF